jgi:hypothetical protein
MIYESKTYGLVDLSKIGFIRKEFLFKEKKYLIVFQMTSGYVSWRYDTEEERNKEFDSIRKVWR